MCDKFARNRIVELLVKIMNGKPNKNGKNGAAVSYSNK